MTRPAIVIGLGGTGQWILTFLKKDLLEIGKGQMPPGVRLLCFDTTTKAMAEFGHVEAGRQSETEIKLGSVKLEHDIEFIPIGDNVYDLCRSIRDGQEDPRKQQHPHIASWLDAEDMLKRHMRTTFNLAEGAGQVRQFGRLAIFNDLLLGAKSKTMGRLRQAVSDLRKEVSGKKQLEVIIIASFAGGTGAGMFIDLGILARNIASQMVEKNLCVRGFYILPRVFKAQDTEMQARSFAAWRELDRFLMIGEKYGQRKLNYNPNDPKMELSLNERIFDVCYLVDAVGKGLNSMENILPEQGLYPMVADVISTIMDNKAGQTYTEYITSNLAGKIDALPRAPYHSAIGAYTIKVPVYFALQLYAHQYALDVLKKFLRPVEDVEKKLVTGVSANANEERPGYDGKRGSLEFLRARSSADFGLVGEGQISHTSFPHIVADIREKEEVNNGALIQRVAMMNLAAAGARPAEANLYFGALVNIGEDEKGKKLIKEVENELYLQLAREVPPSRIAKDTPEAAFSRIKNKTPNFITDHYGQKLSDGTERRGKFGDALAACQKYQVDRFREMLYKWLAATLNGTVDDQENAKGGKIGYTRETLDQIAASLGYFNEFFAKVRKERTERLAKLKLEETSARALKVYDQHKSNKCMFTPHDSFVHPRAHMKQIAYLRAEQARIDARKYDILLNALTETADQMKTITERARDEMDSWIDYLATGDAERQIDGLYGRVKNSLDMAQSNHFRDKQLEKVQRIIGEQTYQSEPEKVKELLGRFEWSVSLPGGQLAIGLGVKVPKDESSMELKEFQRTTDAADHNLRLMLSLGEGQYANLPRQAPVAKLLMDTFASPSNLADAVNQRAEPLYEASSSRSDPKIVSRFIRVDTDNDGVDRAQAKTFMTAFGGRLNQLDALAVETEFQLLPSDNEYRMTLMRSDDLLLSEGFALWKTCRDSYEQLVTKQRIPADRFHVYPAERNAAFYEEEIYSKLRKEYRTLHPSVVALLEDRLWFEYFLLGLAYGFIHKERAHGQEIYMLELPEQERVALSQTFDDVQLYRAPNFLDVIDVFVNRRTAIDNPRQWIDLGALQTAVKERLKEIEVEGAKERLQFQLDNPAGIVPMLLTKVKEDRKRVPQAEQLFTSVEFEDLANVATTVYKRSLNNLSGG
jgi:hypothetical protein